MNDPAAHRGSPVFSAPLAACPLCPRLTAFREQNRQAYHDYYNGAVPSFGHLSARLLIIGLAPGLKGANRTGRPFTGDYAGDVLYPALLRHGFAEGVYGADPADGLVLRDARITNAVRCVPPENKPETSEVKTCNGFLKAEIAAMPHLSVILSLGGISHKAALLALGYKQSAFAFAHGGMHTLKAEGGKVHLLGSYHTSRYNINTGRLSIAMFDEVMAMARRIIPFHDQ